MKILLACRDFRNFSGVTTFVRDMANELSRRGHQVAVFSPRMGPVASALDKGVWAVSRAGDVPFTPQILHCHSRWETVQALKTFPQLRAVWTCHDATAKWEQPLRLPRIRRYVAVDLRCLARVERALGLSRREIPLIMNAVDLDRFSAARVLPRAPRRALVFSNYARNESYLVPVKRACAAQGLDLEVIGHGVGRELSAPQEQLGQYDIVFAKAKCAMEAMAMGCAVILCDFSGLGKMVTSGDFDAFRPMNFGAALLDRPILQHLIENEITRYDAADAARVSAQMRASGGLGHAVDQWIALYQQILSEPLAAPDPAERRDLWRIELGLRGMEGLIKCFRPLQSLECVPLVGGPLLKMARRARSRIPY